MLCLSEVSEAFLIHIRLYRSDVAGVHSVESGWVLQADSAWMIVRESNQQQAGVIPLRVPVFAKTT